MVKKAYDVIIVGGGVGGSALAFSMAKQGADVLVLEAEVKFRDRVRGEFMAPWGVVEAKKLGLYDALMDSGGHELRWLNTGSEDWRDLATTTKPMEPALALYHPEMQENLIQIAENSGAEVYRGIRVKNVKRNAFPSVIAQIEGQDTEIHARIVIGADGRMSSVRKWTGFKLNHDEEQNLIAGLLFDDMSAPDEASHVYANRSLGQVALFFPQGAGRVRGYVVYPANSNMLLSGNSSISRFIELSIKLGMLEEYFANAKPIGPLATFNGADMWVEHPYQDGVALIGDAASASDPTYGQGLSLTLRDSRTLRDKLVGCSDWGAAGHAYAEEHDTYYNTLHIYESWRVQVSTETGPEADALRERIFPLWQQDPTREPDIFFSGPDVTLDETARRRFFGED